jgi:single-stranded-DNA-specific exonuclease
LEKLNIFALVKKLQNIKSMRWTFKPEPDSKKIEILSKELSVDRIIAKILLQRGIENYEQAKAFFRPSLSHLHDPFLMKDMNLAVSRIEKALKKGENILVYGDYDVDGTTAVALVSQYLQTKQPNIGTYVPDRDTEGYGISYQGIDYADDNDFSLIIALDCGIKEVKKIAYANEKNIDMIICDHHTPGETSPDAIAILNPKQSNCNYPFKELSGCAIGFKLVQALHQKEGKSVEELVPYLDLVATSIAADIVPMVGENRVLTYFGLQIINNNPSVGIKALMGQVDKKQMDITDVVFLIAPRINAAGRLKHAKYAVELLIEENPEKANEMALAISNINTDRKSLDQNITKEALNQVTLNNEKYTYSTVVYNENWHKGVVGIVASRLIETHYRPTIVFTKSGDLLVASARSVKGFDLYEALEASSEYIVQFGGHKYAAGLQILPENLEKFKEKFETVVKESIAEELREPEIKIDSEIFLSDITPKFYRILEQMAPFGPYNMHPVFMASGLRDNGYSRNVGSDLSHLKFSIIEGANSKTYNGIGFGLAEKLPLLQNPFKAVFTLDENKWNDTSSIQLKIKDIKED